MSVNRCYSEKKNGFDVEARSLFSSLHDLLEIKNLTHVRYLCRYDAEGLAPETYEKAKGIVFSEPMADVCYDEDFPRPEGAHTILAVEPLPGQFDQRADSCASSCSPAANARPLPLLKSTFWKANSPLRTWTRFAAT